MEDKITITMEEYKELLIIKGKYEELKQNSIKIREFDYDKSWRQWNEPVITYCGNKTTDPLPEHQVKIICNTLEDR